MSLSQWFRKQPRRSAGLTAHDYENLKVLANKSTDRPYEVTLEHLGSTPKTIYVENPGQVEYFKAADKALQAFSR
ncbi:MAG: hypothetical protein ACOC84_10795 [Actinomycetota bacterium]